MPMLIDDKHLPAMLTTGPMTDDQFALEQPAGADVVHLGQPNSTAAKTTHGQ